MGHFIGRRRLWLGAAFGGLEVAEKLLVPGARPYCASCCFHYVGAGRLWTSTCSSKLAESGHGTPAPAQDPPPKYRLREFFVCTGQGPWPGCRKPACRWIALLLWRGVTIQGESHEGKALPMCQHRSMLSMPVAARNQHDRNSHRHNPQPTTLGT